MEFHCLCNIDVVLHLIASGQEIGSLFSAAAGLKSGQFDRKKTWVMATDPHRKTQT
jgi:hypothetical protein